MNTLVTISIASLCIAVLFGTWWLQISSLRDYRKRLDQLIAAVRAAPNRPMGKQPVDLRPYLVPTAQDTAAARDGKVVLHTWPMPLLMREEAPGRASPGLLTALGILGTFIGLTMGLQGLTLDEGSAELVGSVQKLLGGMSGAFWTSLIGIGCGAIAIFSHGLAQSRMTSTRKQAFQKVQAITSLMLPGQALATLDPTGSAEAARAQGKAAKALSESAQHLRDFRAEHIGEIVGAQVTQALQSNMRPAFDRMAESLDQIRRHMENQNRDLLDELVRDLRDQVIEPLAKRVDESSATTKRAAEAVETLHRELGGIATQLGDSVEKLSLFQRDTLEQLNDFQEDLAGTLGKFREETTLVLDRVGTQLTQTVRMAGDETVRLIDTARENLDRSFQNIDVTMQRVRETVEEQLIRFRDEYQTSLESFFEEQNRLLEESLGDQREGLHRVVERLDATFKEEYERRAELGQQLASQLEDLGRARDEIEGLLQAVGATTAGSYTQLHETAKSLSHTLAGVEGRYKDLDEQLSASMLASHKELARFLDEAQATYTSAFESFDSGAGTVLSQLALGADEYMRALRQLKITSDASA